MFTEMRVRNFKSWQESGPIKMAPVTGFFGPNSSGKTSLLQALLLLKQTVESVDRRQVLDLGDERRMVGLGLMTEVIHNHDRGSRLEFGFAWRDKTLAKDLTEDLKGVHLDHKGSFRFNTRIRLGRSNAPYVDELLYTADQVEIRHARRHPTRNYDLQAAINGNTEYLQRKRGRPSLPPPVKCYGFPDASFSQFDNSGFLSHFVVSLEQLFDRLYYLGPLREKARRSYSWQGSEPSSVGVSGERAIEAFLASESRPSIHRKLWKDNRRGYRHPIRTVVKEWIKELKLADDFDVKRIASGFDLYRVMIKLSPESTEVLLPDVGFGVSQVLPVLVLLAYVPKGSVVILEQPELHLHPSVQSGLADIILETARVRRAQIIVESHSEHLLMRIQRRIVEERYKKDDAALYFCSHMAGGSRIERLELDSYGRIANWPREFFGDRMAEAGAMVDAGIRRSRR